MKFEVGLSAKLVMLWLFFRNFTDTPLGFEVGLMSNALMSLGVAGIFFLSIIIHEFSHAALMSLYGIRVERVKLMFFGGYTQAMPGYGDHDTWHPFKDFCISAAGPLSNIAAAVVLYQIYWDQPVYKVFGLVAGTGGSYTQFGLVSYLVTYAVFFNLVVGLFNFLPIVPLDGGHVLRAILVGCFKRRWIADMIAGTFSLAAGLLGLYLLGDNMSLSTITDRGVFGVIDSLFNLGLLGLLCIAMTIMGFLTLRKSFIMRVRGPSSE